MFKDKYSHVGQSSQLVFDANTRNARFLPPLAKNGLTVIGSKNHDEQTSPTFVPTYHVLPTWAIALLTFTTQRPYGLPVQTGRLNSHVPAHMHTHVNPALINAL